MEDELSSTTLKFTEHIFDGSGNKIMNSIQYTAMSIVPLLMVNGVLETQLPVFSPNTPPLSMIIETSIHMIILLIVLYFVDRTVRYFPSSSGEKYGEISFETIGLLLVLLVVNSHNSNLGKKVLHLSRHVKERFTNREGLEPKKIKATVTEKKQEDVLKKQIGFQTKQNTTELEEHNGDNDHLTNKSKELFQSGGGGCGSVEPTSSLDSFALTGGNYSPF